MNDTRALTMIMELGNLIVQQGEEIRQLGEKIDAINEVYGHLEYNFVEAGRILNRSTKTIRNWVESGRLPHTLKTDGSIVITKHNIDEYHGRINARTRARDRKNGQNGTYDGTHAGKVKTFSEG